MSGANESIIELSFSMIRDASETISGRQTVRLARLLIVDWPRAPGSGVRPRSAVPILFGLSLPEAALPDRSQHRERRIRGNLNHPSRRVSNGAHLPLMPVGLARAC